VGDAVSKECRQLLELRAKTLVENILQEEMHLAFSDIRLIPGCPADIPDEIAYAIQSFQIEEDVIKSLSEDSDLQVVRRRTKFTLWPKGAALERLSKHLGLYEQDNRQRGGDQRPQINLYLEQGDVKVLAQGQLPVEANGYGEGD
jgi:phage terminase small subunit